LFIYNSDFSKKSSNQQLINAAIALESAGDLFLWIDIVLKAFIFSYLHDGVVVTNSTLIFQR